MSPAKKFDALDERRSADEPMLEAETETFPSYADPRVRSETDLFEVPATVVCAICGDPDCMGCLEERSKSGVISIVAWERSGPALGRLWATAKASTQSAEAFFEALPDGGLMSALRFAIVAEFVASASMLLGFASVAAIGMLLLGIMPDASVLIFAARVAFVAVMALTVILVAAHATHGYALDLGARRSGGEKSVVRSLRFGLYATGWDLMLGPVGFFVLLVREGPKSAFGLLRYAVGLPTRSSVAFLRGAYRIDGDNAKPALRTSYVGAALATVVSALLILVGIGFALVH